MRGRGARLLLAAPPETPGTNLPIVATSSGTTALHLALASFYRMDFLLTWNCRHIANANKVPYLETLNRGMGLAVPRLTTPHNLQPWEPLP